MQNISSKLLSPEFISQHRKNKKDFTRNRVLTLPQLVTFLMNMVNGSIQSELSRFFQILQSKSFTLEQVSAAAFCKARKKFYATAFSALNDCLTRHLYQSAFAQTWNGLRLLAVDGSTAKLPEKKALFEHFGKTSPHANYPSARLSQLYDVINKISIDVQISPMSIGERALACRHLEYASRTDLMLYDRGYAAFWLFALQQHKNIPYCARMTVTFSSVIKAFVASKEKDKIVELSPTRHSIKKCKELGIAANPLKVRLIRIVLENGEVEVLATSLLDMRKFPRKAFIKLYHQRWFIEEDYKIMKSRLEVENFSGFSVEAVQQDIHAKVLTKNIAAVAILEANVLAKEKYLQRKREYRINFSYTLSQFKDNIVRFITGMIPTDMYSEFIEGISRAVNAVRPERKFERKLEKINKKRFAIAYKRTG